jgi:hypothetical protein
MINFKPGRELDALIAEKVMGKVDDAASLRLALEEGMEYGAVPRYSADIAAAWEVVKRLGEGDFILERWPEFKDDRRWRSSFGRGVDFSYSSTASHAICLAALKAVGVES